LAVSIRIGVLLPAARSSRHYRGGEMLVVLDHKDPVDIADFSGPSATFPHHAWAETF
jgi:hypothetical protein